MQNSITSTVLIVVFGLVFLAAAVCAGMYFWNKLFHQAVTAAKERIADSQLIVSMNTASGGRRLVVKVSPYDINDDGPEFPNEPMGGQDIPIDLLDRFFSGTLPAEQLEYIESKLRMQNIFISRDGSNAVQTSAAPAASASAPVVNPPVCEPAVEEDPADEKPSGFSSDLPFGDSESPSEGESGSDHLGEAEDVPSDDGHQDDVSGDTEGSIDGLAAPDLETEDVDYEHIKCGSDIPSYLMDILMNATQNDVKVACYYCACRLGLQINYKFDPSQKENNRAFLRDLRNKFDDQDRSQVVSFTVDYSGTHERHSNISYPIIDGSSLVGAPVFPNS